MTENTDDNSKTGKLFVISGPSGVGKGTLVDIVSKRDPDIWVSVSATTRLPREGEVDGTDYFFYTKDEFEKLIAEDGFVEYAEYNGNFYGTPSEPIAEHLAEGKNVILEIEVQGAFQVRKKFPDAVLLFIEPPDFDTLKARLEARATESDDVIESRLETARMELAHKMEYDIQLVNNDLEAAADELSSYLK